MSIRFLSKYRNDIVITSLRYLIDIDCKLQVSVKNVCNSLIFIPENGGSGYGRIYQDDHLKRCISGNIISNEHAILKSIDRREFEIWQYK
jgi:hypothetical protein